MEMHTTWLMRLSLMLLAAVTLSATNLVRAGEKEQTIKLVDLPPKVRESVKLATVGGEIEKVELTTEGGKKVYEIEAEVEGGTVELVFNGDGQLIGIEVADAEADEGDDGDEEADGDEDEDEEEHGSEVSKTITIDDVPSAARSAISKRAGEAKLVGIESVTEAGQTVYEAAWINGDAKVEVIVSASGSLIAEESSLALDQLPKELRAIAEKFAGKAELKLERKTVVLYELEKVSGGKEVEMFVDAAGREVKVSIGSGEDDQDEVGNDDDDDDDDGDDDGDDDDK
ncbi:MAG: OB-fold nucleic acid binding domain-containing protein [Pirellulaceae bacterium]|jgi:hypothetical protein|nr:OB-fold nucleic acid binding domain-containing protein [Pirellulaceae bacterium]